VPHILLDRQSVRMSSGSLSESDPLAAPTPWLAGAAPACCFCSSAACRRAAACSFSSSTRATHSLQASVAQHGRRGQAATRHALLLEPQSLFLLVGLLRLRAAEALCEMPLCQASSKAKAARQSSPARPAHALPPASRPRRLRLRTRAAQPCDKTSQECVGRSSSPARRTLYLASVAPRHVLSRPRPCRRRSRWARLRRRCWRALRAAHPQQPFLCQHWRQLAPASPAEVALA